MGHYTAFRRDIYDKARISPFPLSASFDIATARNLAWAAQLAYETANEAKFKDILRSWGWRFGNFLHGTSDGWNLLSRLAGLLVRRKPIAVGYVAHAEDATIIAFAGTEPDNPRQWHIDFSIDIDDGVHQGFAEGVRSIWKALHPHLDHATAIYIAGHSLGAALAAVTARRICVERPADAAKIRGVYTMGMPRAFPESTARLYNASLPAPAAPLGRRTFRLVHGNDVVPHVPPTIGPTHYRHVGAALSCRRDGSFNPQTLSPADIESAEAAPLPGIEDFIKQLSPANLAESLANADWSSLDGLKAIVNSLPGDKTGVSSSKPSEPFPAEDEGIAGIVALLPPFVRDHLMDGYLRGLGADI